MAKKELRFSPKFMRVTITVLIILVLVLAFVNRGNSAHVSNTLTVYQGQKQLKVYNLDELAALPAISAEKTIVSASRGNEYGVFTGVDVKYLLIAAGADLSQCREIITKASDGYTSVLFLEDIAADGNVLVVYAKDGQPLKGKEEKGAGPLRIVVVGDDFGNRSTMYLTEIIVN